MKSLINYIYHITLKENVESILKKMDLSQRRKIIVNFQKEYI